MLARLVLASQNGELQGIEGIGGQGFGGEGGTIVVDENCQVGLFRDSNANVTDDSTDHVEVLTYMGLHYFVARADTKKETLMDQFRVQNLASAIAVWTYLAISYDETLWLQLKSQWTIEWCCVLFHEGRCRIIQHSWLQYDCPIA